MLPHLAPEGSQWPLHLAAHSMCCHVPHRDYCTPFSSVVLSFHLIADLAI